MKRERMRILVTNDDGIHAPGLKVCEQIARELSDDVWVIAPEYDQSGVSHSLSLNDPLRLRQIGERHYAVKGTPTDCVIMGARHMLPEPPDLVLSGVNRGRNAAEDVLYSGTVAGAKEAAVLGIPSFALSQAIPRSTSSSRTGTPRSSTRPRSSAACSRPGIPRDVLVNVNFPDCPPGEVKGISVVDQGKRDQQLLHIDARHDGRGNPYYWIAYARGARPTGKRRHRPLRARRQPHRGDAAAARPDRRAVHDQARRAVSVTASEARMPPSEGVERMEFMLMLRRRGISDQAVLRAMDEVPREHFVEPRFADSAYADQALPIACGQTISQPYVVAYMTEQLEVRAEPSRARSRHRLGLPGGGAVAAGARGGHARALPHAGRQRARAAEDARLRQRRGAARRRPCAASRCARRSTASSSPRRPRACRRRWSSSSPRAASWCCRSGRTAAPQELVKLTKTARGLERETLLPVRFVPLLPGQAREL